MEKINLNSVFSTEMLTTQSALLLTGQRENITSMSHIKNIQTAVTSAVEHLRDLSTRMSCNDVNNIFKVEDISKIDRLIEAIKELEEERNRSHEVYETETIKSSKLRYDLLYFPDRSDKENEISIQSARASNAAIMHRLDEQLKSHKTEISELEQKHKNLEAENTILHPQREAIRQKHEEIISSLNLRLADKAAAQITLNETRDKVRQTNEAILVLEDNIIKLKDDLIEERSTARLKKKHQKQCIADTVSNITDQKHTNSHHREVLDDLRLDHKLCSTKVQGLKKNIIILKKSLTSLESSEKKQSIRHQILMQENEVIIHTGVELDEEDLKEDEEFESKKKKSEQALLKHEINVSKFEEQLEKLQEHLQKLKKECDEKMENLDKVTTTMIQRQDSVMELKENLIQQTDKVSSVQEETADLETRGEQANERHKGVLAQLNKKIEDYRVDLNAERSQRMALQTTRDCVTKDLEDYKIDTQEFMASVNKQIHDNKIEHVQLTDEGTEIQNTLINNESRLKQLRLDLVKTRQECEDMEVELARKESIVAKEIEEIMITVYRKKSELELKSPEFETFDNDYQEEVKEYSGLKQEIVELKNLRTKLMDDITKFTADKENLANPTMGLRCMLKKKRDQQLAVMAKNMEEVTLVETSICNTGCKVKKIINENFKFSQNIEKQQEEIRINLDDAEDGKKATQSMVDEYDRLQKLLWEGWKKDKLLQEETERRDVKFVKELGLVMEETSDRVKTIDSITERLETEIRHLSTFLNNVAHRRPADARKKRLQRQETPVDSPTPQPIDKDQKQVTDRPASTTPTILAVIM